MRTALYGRIPYGADIFKRLFWRQRFAHMLQLQMLTMQQRVVGIAVHKLEDINQRRMHL